MIKELNYGIIGCGRFGNSHLRALVPMQAVNIVALCDNYIEKCHETKKTHNLDSAACYTDYNEMFANHDFDVIVVATNDQAHAQATIDALRAGYNVMCEKPMALHVDECIDMINAQKETGKLLMVGQVCRFTPGFVKAKEIIESGMIGDIYYVESEYAHDYAERRGTNGWRTDKDREPVIGGACHAIDLLRWLAGDPVETMAYSNHKVLTDWPVNDTTVAIMKFPNDVIGKVFTSIGCKRNYTMRTLVYGTKGTIIVDNTNPYIQLCFDKSSKDGHFADGFFGMGTEEEMIHTIPIELNNHNVTAEHKAMREAIIDGKPLLMTGEEGAKTVIVCRAVVEAAASGKAVAIDYTLNK